MALSRFPSSVNGFDADGNAFESFAICNLFSEDSKHRLKQAAELAHLVVSEVFPAYRHSDCPAQLDAAL